MKGKWALLIVKNVKEYIKANNLKWQNNGKSAFLSYSYYKCKSCTFVLKVVIDMFDKSPPVYANQLQHVIHEIEDQNIFKSNNFILLKELIRKYLSNKNISYVKPNKLIVKF